MLKALATSANHSIGEKSVRHVGVPPDQKSTSTKSGQHSQPQKEPERHFLADIIEFIVYAGIGIFVLIYSRRRRRR